MKQRTFLSGILFVGVLAALLWWFWSFTAPDVPVPSAASAQPVRQPVASSVIIQGTLPQEPASPASTTELNSSVNPTTVAATDATGRISLDAIPVDGPPMPDAVYLTTPLENAEHHTFTLKTMAGYTFDVSITGYSHVRNGQGNGLEQINLHVWQNAGTAHITQMRLPLGYFQPEDQKYIRDWARQQAAAAATPSASTSSEAPTP